MKKKKNIIIWSAIVLLLICVEIFTIAYLKNSANYWEKRNKFDLESFDYEYDGFGYDRLTMFVDNNGEVYLKDNDYIDYDEIYQTYIIDTIVSSNSDFKITKTLSFKGYKFDIKNITDLFGVAYKDNNYIFIIKSSKNDLYYIDYLSIINNHDYELKKLNKLSNLTSIYNKSEVGIYAKNSSGKEIEITNYFTEIYGD